MEEIPPLAQSSQLVEACKLVNQSVFSGPIVSEPSEDNKEEKKESKEKKELTKKQIEVRDALTAKAKEELMIQAGKQL